MWETLSPAVSEAGQKTFPKCKEGAEGHRALTTMGSYKRWSQSGVPFVMPSSPYMLYGIQSVPAGDEALPKRQYIAKKILLMPFLALNKLLSLFYCQA